MSKRILQVTVVICTLITTPLFGQSNSDYDEQRSEILQQQSSTRSEIEQIDEQIQNYRSRLEVTSQKYDNLYRQYQELTRLISLQNEKIRQLNVEQRQVTQELNLISENLTELESDLNELVQQFQQTLTYYYKHGRTTELALMLTSTSMNQLLVRAYYLTKFDEYTSAQTDLIHAKQRELELSRADLEASRERNIEIRAEIEEETETLAIQEEDLKNNIELLQADQESLNNQLARVEQDRSQLMQFLTVLINEEDRLQRAEEERLRRLAEANTIEDDDEREEAIERYSTPTPRRMVSETESSAFETSFASARGQLPWPVDGGTITEKFGERVNPVFGTRVNNPGIDIAVPGNSQVRVVSDGYVHSIQPLSGIGDMVVVQHGRYITVYGNLSDIFITRDRVLRQGDVIGLSGGEDSIRGEVLFFVVSEGDQFINPESWLQNRTP